MAVLNEFGFVVFVTLDEYGIRKMNGLDEEGLKIFPEIGIEYRDASDSGTGTDTMPYIEVKVEDSGGVVA